MTLIILVIVTALVFEYINGFHDAANAIATVISTKVLTPRQAVIFGATLEFVGALAGAILGTHVAKTIGAGIVSGEAITQSVIICALVAAIIWNLITWYFGIPSSSSHALIGGLIGAALMHSHSISHIHFMSFLDKVLIPMILSPAVGLTFGFIFMIVLLHLFYKSHPDHINQVFRKSQLVSSGFMAVSHGMNDAQKTMGIITMSLVASGFLPEFKVPFWVIFICACTMAMGVLTGGMKIIKTIGNKVMKMKPIHGFAAQTASAIVILTASSWGIPLSTTQVMSTSVMGVGCTKKTQGVKWGVVGNIVMAWIITIPFCVFISALIYYLQHKFL